MKELISCPDILKAAALLILLAQACAGECVGHIRLRAAQGGYFDVCEGSSRPQLLAFLRVVPDRADTPSRSQAVFLSSMYEQYGRRGLGVAAVDASDSSHRLLLNATYDWQLSFPLLEDADGRAKKAFDVTVIPSVLLLAPDGKVLERWNGLASSAALARAVEALLGGPLSQMPRSAIPAANP